MVPQNAYVDSLRQQVQTDNRVTACWLEGSLGKNAGDRYSDVDAHLLICRDDLVSFRQQVRDFLETVSPLVFFRTLFDGQMVNALTKNGLRVDIWTHGDDTPIVRHPSTATPVWERTPGVLTWDTSAQSASTPANAAALVERNIGEFWRCIAILPSVIGRGEKIVAVLGFFAELAPLTDTLILGTGATRDAGVKQLNRFLPPGTQAEIENALEMRDLSVRSLANAHMALAAVMQKHGPGIAARFGVPYPTEMETAVMDYVRQELNRIFDNRQGTTP